MPLTQEEVQYHFDYKDGELYWKNPTSYRTKKGAKVGTKRFDGYIQTAIKGKRYLHHRLIFLFFNGYLPEFLDHINNNRTDNRLENLRPATRSQNNCNSGIRKDNCSGVKGVSFNKNTKKWVAKITSQGVIRYLGMYEDINEAKKVIEHERKKLHKEYAKHE